MEKKRMTKTIVLIACVMATLLVAGMANAAPFQNGSFETYTNWQQYYAADDHPFGITGWEVTSAPGTDYPPYGLRGGIQRCSWEAYQMYPGSDLGNMVLLCYVWGGGIKQTFDTTVGHQYQVDFWMAGNTGGVTPIRHATVTAAATNADFYFDTTGKSGTNMGWIQNTLMFTATDAQSTLAFSSVDSMPTNSLTFIGPMIDGVSVTDLGVPAPIIANGSFEDVSSGTGPNYGSSENPEGITGWTAGRTEGGGTDSPSGVTRYEVGAEGSHSISLCWKYGGSIRQTFNTVAGKRYQIDFKLAGNPAYAQVNHLDVMTSGAFAPGTETHFTFDSTGKTLENMGWAPESVFIDATASTTTIIFSSDDANSINNYSGPVIDDVVATNLGSSPSAPLVKHGDFENFTGDWGAGYNSANNPYGVTGWRSFGRDQDATPYGTNHQGWDAYQMEGGTLGVPAINNNCVSLRWVFPGGIEQILDTIEGHQYQVDFSMAGDTSGSTPIRNMRVTAGPTQEKFSFDTTGKTASNMGWTRKSMPFVADSAKSTLQFLNTGVTEWCANSPFIDNVSATDLGVASPLIVNGSFETISPGSGPYYGAGATPAGITAWTADTAEGGGSGTPAGVTRMDVAAAGDHSVCLSWQYGGSIRQTFNSVAGHRYRIDFKMAGNPAYAQINHLDVIANGSASQFTFDSTGKSLTDMGWVKQSVMLDATSSSSTIIFSSTDANYSGPVIDDVVATDIGLAPAQPKSIGDAKSSPDGVSLQVSGVVSGLLMGGDIYLETPDRVSGIRINQASYAFTPGDNVTLIGEMSTRSSGERQVALNEIVQQTGGTALLPLGMTNKSIGGGASGNPPEGQVGVTGGAGLNNIGLLVRTTGTVYNSDLFTTFYLDDGSGVILKVVDDFSEVIPNDGDYISVTGVVSCEKVGSDILPVLFVTSY